MIESNTDIGWLLALTVTAILIFIFLIAVPIYENWKMDRQEKALREQYQKQRAAFAARRTEQVS